MKPVAQNNRFVEGQSWFRTVPGDELIDGMLISTPRVRGAEAPQDCGFRVFQIRNAGLILGRFFLVLLVDVFLIVAALHFGGS